MLNIYIETIEKESIGMFDDDYKTSNRKGFSSWSSKLPWHLLIKSHWYTGGDFYVFVLVRMLLPPPPAADFVHAITFEQLSGFILFFARLLALTCRLPDLILVDFGRELDLDFSRSNMKFAISQAKNDPIATKRKANILIDL